MQQKRDSGLPSRPEQYYPIGMKHFRELVVGFDMGQVSTSFGVLVVEDESLIRLATVEIIRDAGYRVHEASDADDAIRVLELHEDIRFVFTDINMPGSMSGLKLAHYVRHRWPPIRLLLTSGGIPLRQDQLPTDSVFLTKPYAPDRVLDELRRSFSGH